MQYLFLETWREELCETFIRKPCIIENLHCMRFQATLRFVNISEKFAHKFQHCVRRFLFAQQAVGNFSPQWTTLKQQCKQVALLLVSLWWKRVSNVGTMLVSCRRIEMEILMLFHVSWLLASELDDVVRLTLFGSDLKKQPLATQKETNFLNKCVAKFGKL